MAVVDVRYLSIIYTIMLIMRQPQNTNYGHSQRCPIVSPVSVFVEGAEPVDPSPQQEPAHPHPGALAVRVAEPGRRLEGHYLSASCHAILCRYKREMLSEVSNRDIDVIHQYIKGGHF